MYSEAKWFLITLSSRTPWRFDAWRAQPVAWARSCCLPAAYMGLIDIRAHMQSAKGEAALEHTMRVSSTAIFASGMRAALAAMAACMSVTGGAPQGFGVRCARHQPHQRLRATVQPPPPCSARPGAAPRPGQRTALKMRSTCSCVNRLYASWADLERWSSCCSVSRSVSEMGSRCFSALAAGAASALGGAGCGVGQGVHALDKGVHAYVYEGKAAREYLPTREPGHVPTTHSPPPWRPCPWRAARAQARGPRPRLSSTARITSPARSSP